MFVYLFIYFLHSMECLFSFLIYAFILVWQKGLNMILYNTKISLLSLFIPPSDLYEVTLPTDLPPTHRGKTIRINYNLIIGTQRGAVNHQSHVVQLPFRVFNHVSGTFMCECLAGPLPLVHFPFTFFCRGRHPPCLRPHEPGGCVSRRGDRTMSRRERP